MVLANAFSLQMLTELPADINVKEVSITEASEMAKTAISCVGHADTAAVFTAVLGTPVACNRGNIQLANGEQLLVGQLTGGRLPEGATKLPEGFTLKWLLVTVK